MKTSIAAVLCAVAMAQVCQAFVPAAKCSSTTTTLSPTTTITTTPTTSTRNSKTSLRMGLDLVTYLRTEWISAAICTNQTPRSADTVLQLGSGDGRAVTFLPRTVRQLFTSSAEKDGKLTVQARRQLKQQEERRGVGATVVLVDQAADDLTETANESIDVVISLQCAAVLIENGRDWKKSVREAARVLKPGGRFLFCEQTSLDGSSYLEYIQTLLATSDDAAVAEPVSSDDDDEAEETRLPVFSEVGFDNVDLVLTPHIAGVAVKSEDAGMTPKERQAKYNKEEKERVADLSLEAYERGNKKRRRKKKSKEPEEAASP